LAGTNAWSGGEEFRRSPALANIEFLRGYAGCPVPQGLGLAIDLALEAAGGYLSVHALADRVARASGLDERLCSSAILHKVWERTLFADIRSASIGSHAVVWRAPR
jgi:hypothetical protein